MHVSLETVRSIASEVARQEHEDLEVLGVRAGGDDYVEILISLNNCEIEPCRVILGVFRDERSETLRSAISQALHDHLEGRSS